MAMGEVSAQCSAMRLQLCSAQTRGKTGIYEYKREVMHSFAHCLSIDSLGIKGPTAGSLFNRGVLIPYIWIWLLLLFVETEHRDRNW